MDVVNFGYEKSEKVIAFISSERLRDAVFRFKEVIDGGEQSAGV